jgi:hypothetical protein
MQRSPTLAAYEPQRKRRSQALKFFEAPIDESGLLVT